MASNQSSSSTGRRQAKKSSAHSGGQPRDVLVSKKLSWLLRHGAEKEGLKLGKGGYIPLDHVLQNRTMKSLKVTLSEVRQVVADNEKQRFSLVHMSAYSDGAQDVEALMKNLATGSNADDDPSHYLIRANQGHSLKIGEDDLLTPITTASNNLPETVVHGTRGELWRTIESSGGLKPMSRNHIHFATGIPESIQSSRSEATKPQTELPSIQETKETHVTLSGMRFSSTLFIFIDLPKALGDGLKFWISQNGVVLSDGGPERLLQLKYFKSVEERNGNVLVKDGTVIGKLSKNSAVATQQIRKESGHVVENEKEHSME